MLPESLGKQFRMQTVWTASFQPICGKWREGNGHQGYAQGLCPSKGLTYP